MKATGRPVLLRLDSRQVAGRLGRPLRGSRESGKETGEYALLRVVNEAEPAKARETIAAAEPTLEVGLDFLALVNDFLDKLQAESEATKTHPVEIPKAVWNEYAQRAREEHRPIRVLLTEGLVAHAENVRRAKEGEARATRLFQVAERGFREQLALFRELTEKAAANAVDVSRVRDQLDHNGVALTAILMTLHDQKKLSSRAVELLRKKRWMD
jgi:hypothetical protein